MIAWGGVSCSMTSLTPSRLQFGHVLVGHDAAGDDDEVLGALLLQEPEDFREHGELDAGEETDAEHVHVLLDGGGHHLVGRAVQAGIDDVHAGVAERPRHDLDAAVVAVEPDLGEKHPDRLLHPLLPFCRHTSRVFADCRSGARGRQKRRRSSGPAVLAVWSKPLSGTLNRCYRDSETGPRS